MQKSHLIPLRKWDYAITDIWKLCYKVKYQFIATWVSLIGLLIWRCNCLKLHIWYVHIYYNFYFGHRIIEHCVAISTQHALLANITIRNSVHMQDIKYFLLCVRLGCINGVTLYPTDLESLEHGNWLTSNVIDACVR